MAVNKNFVVKNGFEVNNDLIFANADTNKVGIGSTGPRVALDVRGGIGATDINAVGVITAGGELRVGTFGNVFSVISSSSSVGVGTNYPGYLLDIRSPVSTGQTAIYVKGDGRITGNLNIEGDLFVDDITFDDATLSNITITEALYVGPAGVSTVNNLVVNGTFDSYSSDSTFHGNVTIDGNVTIGGTSSILNAVELRIEDKDIVLGFTTAIPPSDDTANHGGIAIASTEGTPLVSLRAVGINTLPDTYKQIMWVKSDTMGAGTTDAFLFNYGVGIGSTQVPDGTRLAVGEIKLTDTAVNAKAANLTNLNVSGVSTLGVTTTTNLTSQRLNVSGVSTLGTLLVSSGVVTATSGIITYYGDGSKLLGASLGIGSTGGVVGYGVTFINFYGPGVSTAYYSSTTGIATVYFQGGGGGGGAIGIGSTFPGTPASLDPAPSNGDLFFHINYGRTFIYYDEVDLGIGSTAVWVDAAPFNIGIVTSTIGSLPAGTALTPSLAFVSDTSTGLFSPAGGQQTFVSVGASILNINQGGVRVTGVVTATTFNGSLIGNVTGNATGLSGTPNLNAGIVTASSISVSGNVSIGGTLTYEDVTNVDSIGLITARSGIQVLAGGINAVGVVTATSSIVGSAVTINSSGVNMVGVITANDYDGNFVLDSYLFN